MGKSNPSADFVLEVINMLDADDLEKISRVINKKLNNEKVIDVSPELSESDTSSKINSLAKNLNNDVIMNLLSSLTSKDTSNDIQSNSSSDSTNTSGLGQIGDLLQLFSKSGGTTTAASNTNPLLSLLPSNFGQFLPKILSISQEVFQKQSREENLLNAIIPFVPSTGQETMRKMSGLLKLAQIFKVLRMPSVDT